jgi:hypothetical protein
MKLTFRATRRILGGTALLCAAALLPGTAMASSAPAAKTGHAAWGAPRCKESQTEVWLGLGNGGGAAGTIFYPLEFTNTSKQLCKLWGFPKVWATNNSGHQIGRASRHLGSHWRTIELWPGQTAHAVLGIIQAGNVCSHPVWASGMKVRAPHQGSSTFIQFSFQTCHHGRVLVVGPIQPGVGIP